MLYTFPKYVQYLPYFYKCVQYLLLLCIYNVSLLCKYNINIKRSLENKQKQKQDQTKLVYLKKKKKKRQLTKLTKPKTLFMSLLALFIYLIEIEI